MSRKSTLIVFFITFIIVGGSFTYLLYNGNTDSNSSQAYLPPSAIYNQNATLVWGRESLVDYLNPFLTHYMTVQTVMELVYPALVYWSANMTEMEPYLATSWNINYANGTAIFYLNHNAVWSDGVPITAQDVVWSFDEYKQPWTHEVNWFSSVVSATAINNYTVEIKFTGLSFIYFALPQVIVPYHIWKNVNASSYSLLSNGTFVGGGPLLLSAYTPNADIELVKNPKFWDPDYVVHYAKLIVQDYTSDSTLLAGLESGYVSEAYVDSSMLSALKNNTNLETVGAPSTVDFILEFNQYPNGTGSPALRNIKVREALSYALNLSYLDQLAYRGYYLPTVGVVPPGNPDYNNYLKPWPYNVSLANKLLNESGYKYGPNGYREYPNGSALTLNLDIASGYTQWIAVAPVMVQEWKAIGIQVNVNVQDTATIDSEVSSYSYDMLINDWFSDANFGSELYLFTGSQLHLFANAPGYNNSTYNQLFKEMMSATSLSAAKQDALEMQNLTYWNVTILGLASPETLFSYNKQWSNVPANYSGMVPQYGYGWWILINPEMVTTSTHVSSASNNTPLIISVVVVIVLAIAIGIGLLYRSKKKGAKMQ